MGKDFFDKTSYLFRHNAEYVESLFQKYLEDSSSVEDSWKDFFSSIGDNIEEVRNFSKGANWSKKTVSKFQNQQEKIDANKEESIQHIVKEVTKFITKDVDSLNLKIENFINLYRQNINLTTKLDPLNLEQIKTKSELGISYQDIFSEEELARKLSLSYNFSDKKEASLKEYFEDLSNIYEQNTALEISHIYDIERKEWLIKEFENHLRMTISKDDKVKIFEDVIKSEYFEQYLHVKFPGAKRFSVEGLESSIMAMKSIIEASTNYGMNYCAIGMAHRGRLNTLAHIMNKPYEDILSEFKGTLKPSQSFKISGDVKYHMGYSSDFKTDSGQIHLTLLPNPSHLEAVNPLVAGKVRSHQDKVKDKNREKSFGILVHGDAAFSGQGIVYETLMMSELEAYNIGGIIHIITNNQVGFTTNPKNGRCSRYPTDVAKAISAPIIHINADDVENVYKMALLALKYKHTFKKDIVINIVGYRKYGHNEGDEPLFTQPIMYNNIKNHVTASEKYAKYLHENDIFSDKEMLLSNIKNKLDVAFEISSKERVIEPDWLKSQWSNCVGVKEEQKDKNTGVNQGLLKNLLNNLTSVPSGFNLNKKIEKLFNQKRELAEKDNIVDWATAESLAFATLLVENYNIRFTGQDVERGTFSHRHAVVTDQENENKHIPLNNLSNDQAKLEIYNSNLSEYGVLGFEYGYSIYDPKNLTIWEAQFGDFINGAQIIIDQYISSAETKWLKMSGITLLLPHGFEGQGPEHSSARMERFLELCANDNIQIANCTTPASYFHILRRQMHRNYRKPLIIFSPKSLLRNKYVFSKLEDMDNDTKFLPVLDDYSVQFENVEVLVFMTGKIYYDLHDYREKNPNNKIALIRLEQLYPFPATEISEILNKYKNVKKVIWCQEEPENMGAWRFFYHKIKQILKEHNLPEIIYIGRDENSSPATGYASVHNNEQEQIINNIFKS